MVHAASGKRSKALDPEGVQRGNRSWWSKHPMTYDWRGEHELPKYSFEWFDALDERFLYGARLFATDVRPFDRLIPFEALKGKRVLEIGCGMGLHTELMVRAGAQVTAIDITPQAIEATSRRLSIKDLDANFLCVDAEKLPFDAGSFDFVWSWGVIHHSSRTARIVREVARVLSPGGECRVMVYNRESMFARVAFVRDYLLKGMFLRGTFDESLYRQSDGFSARFFVQEHFEDLFRAFFADVSSEIMGQDSDAVPLPRRLRALALRVIPDSYLRQAQSQRGLFIFLTASRPE